MDRINNAVLHYQQIIGACDKQLWERSVEQAVLKSLHNVTRKTAKVNLDLIDVDLVRGSTFSKSKPQHGWLSLSARAILRVIFLPFFCRWWSKSTCKWIFRLLMLLYMLQAITFFVYFTDPSNGLSADTLSLAHLLSPCFMMFVLALVHTQIMATYLSPSSRRSTSHDKSLERGSKASAGVEHSSYGERSEDYAQYFQQDPVANQDGVFIFDPIPGRGSSKETIPASASTVSNTNQPLALDNTDLNNDTTSVVKSPVADLLGGGETASPLSRSSHFLRSESLESTSAWVRKHSPEPVSRDITELAIGKSLAKPLGRLMYTTTVHFADGVDLPPDWRGLRRCRIEGCDLDSSEIIFPRKSLINGTTNSVVPTTFHKRLRYANLLSVDNGESRDIVAEQSCLACSDTCECNSRPSGDIVEIDNCPPTDTCECNSGTCECNPRPSGDMVEIDDCPPTETVSRTNSCSSMSSIESSVANCSGAVGDAPGMVTSGSGEIDGHGMDVDGNFDGINVENEKTDDIHKEIVDTIGNRANSFPDILNIGIRHRKSRLINGGTLSDTASGVDNSFNDHNRENNTQQHEYDKYISQDCISSFVENSSSCVYDLKTDTSSTSRSAKLSAKSSRYLMSDKDGINSIDTVLPVKRSCTHSTATNATSDEIIGESLDARGIISSGESERDVVKGRRHKAKTSSQRKQLWLSKRSKHLPDAATSNVQTSEWEDTINTDITSCSVTSTANTSASDLSENDLLGPSAADNKTSPGVGIQSISSVMKNLASNTDRVSCVIWESSEVQKVDLTVLDIGWRIIEKVQNLPESCDYLFLGALFSILLMSLPVTYRVYHGKDQLENLNFNNFTALDTVVTLAFGHSTRQAVVIVNGIVQRLCFSLMLFFLLSVAERTFKQRLLYAKNFCYLTSSRRAKKYDLPHFRLNKVRNIKTWLSLRSFLKRRGPQRSVESIVSAAFIVAVILISIICIELLQDYGSFLDHLGNWELTMWCLFLGVYLMRFFTLGTKINKKYRNFSVLITEQINLYLHMEQKPHKKEELMLANSVLKLAEDLLKELESPFKVSGLSANPFLYNITKVVVLSAFSAVLTEILGFKLKLYKIKIRA